MMLEQSIASFSSRPKPNRTVSNIRVSTCHKLTKLLVKFGHDLVNGILDVLDIVLDRNVLILVDVVVGRFDHGVVSSVI